jgi:hypothetical protein
MSITTDLAAVLKSVRRPGDFYVSGTIELMPPRLEVAGVGRIALPVPAQVAALIAAAERAPYGRGAQTLVDTAVRRTWQIGAEAVRIAGTHRQRSLDALRSTTGATWKSRSSRPVSTSTCAPRSAAAPQPGLHQEPGEP